MQKKILFSLWLSLFSVSLNAQEKRTDGPPGSEYGDFDDWDGTTQLGIHFGANVDAISDETSLSLGLDFDYRPTDLFGIRASFEQGVQKPRHSTFFLNPLIHNEYSNLNWYVNFGPGLTLLDLPERKARFLVSMGAGGDFMFNEKIGIGLFWNYSFVFGTSDMHHIGTRLSYQF